MSHNRCKDACKQKMMTQHFFKGKTKLLQAKIYYDKTWIKTRQKKCTLFECECILAQKYYYWGNYINVSYLRPDRHFMSMQKSSHLQGKGGTLHSQLF